MKPGYQTILDNIPFLSEYEQKSLAIILMNFTLNEHQVKITHNQYKAFVKDYINCECEICEGEGFILSNDINGKDEVQKCDECNIFDNDAQAQLHFKEYH